MGGTIGVIFLGIFASSAVNPNGANGLLFGNPSFFFKETISVVLASIYAFLFTYAMLWIINKFTPVRISAQEEELGLDETLHGENAYEI